MESLASLSKFDAIAVNLSVQTQTAIIAPGLTLDDFSGSILQNINGSGKYHGEGKTGKLVIQ